MESPARYPGGAAEQDGAARVPRVRQPAVVIQVTVMYRHHTSLHCDEAVCHAKLISHILAMPSIPAN